jgi:uncharacterized protein (TIGR03083 family)
MQLTPVYGADPLIVLDGPPDAILGPVVRQRRRLVEALGRLDDDQWGRPTRCEGWDVRDVIVHLDSTNSFWSFSIGAGVAGSPTRFLATFDPVASPAALVAGAPSRPPSCSALRSVDRGAGHPARVARRPRVALVRRGPAGHISVSAVAHHALWDSWVHERDILVPLGIEQVVEPDEVAASLAHAAALSPRSPSRSVTVEPVCSG